MFRKTTLICVFLAFCVIVLGAYVRLSDAGLGCPDWPGCYGKLIVPQDVDSIKQANEAFPERPVHSEKAWKEMVHRYLAGTLGGIILLLWMMAWWVKTNKAFSITVSTLLVILVAFQVALGMWTVTLKVMPIIVLAHLIGGLIMLCVLFWLYWRSDPTLPVDSSRNGLRWFARFAFCVLLLQIALGGWTSTNYAAFACPDFPTCNGQWWPILDFTEAFRLWRDIGIDYEGGVLAHDARVTIHWVHRLGAIATFLVLGLLAIAGGFSKSRPQLRKASLILFLLLLLQIGLGVGNVLLRMPLFVAVLHNAVAAALVMVLVYINVFVSRVRAFDAEDDFATVAEEVLEPIAKTIPAEVPVEVTPESLFLRLKSQLDKTRTGVTGVLANISFAKRSIDDDLLEEIESNLLMADIGVDVTQQIMQKLADSLQRHQLNDIDALTEVLKKHLYAVLEPCSKPLEIVTNSTPFVILVVGVNGVGKTTTIGKLAKRLQRDGHSVMLAAGDTFRAAAIEQLKIWGERNDIPIISQHTGADSASVIFDAVQSAQARGVDVVIADTAGRLHTKSNLMEELSKIKRIIGKLDENAPQEVLLVLDACTGQNALSQTKQFNQTVSLTGIALTKLDGTAKGGVLFALAKQFGLPIRFIGIGEGIDDLQDFDAASFIDALFDAA